MRRLPSSPRSSTGALSQRLDQPQHMPVDDAARHRPHQLAMRDRIEILRQIGVYHMVKPRHGGASTALIASVAPRPGRSPSAAGRDPPRRSAPAPAWRRFAPRGPGSSGCRAAARLARAWGSSPISTRRWPIRPRNQVLPNAGEPLLQPGRLDRPAKLTPSTPGAPPSVRASAVGVFQDVVAADFVVEQVEAECRAPPSPCDRASSEGSGSSQVLPGSSPITHPRRRRSTRQKSGPFPPPALPGLRQCMSVLSDARQHRRPSRRWGRNPRAEQGLPR